MTLANININFNAILPEIFITAVGLTVLLLDFFLPKKDKAVLGVISIGGLLILLPLVLFTSGSKPSFGGMVISDHFSAFFKIIIILAGVLVILMSMDYLKKMKIYSGEYYYIILFARHDGDGLIKRPVEPVCGAGAHGALFLYTGSLTAL
jgi:NADH-quinone oxidoreductase subunit N